MKSFLPIILVLLVFSKANAQCEIDQSITVPGFYPSFSEGDFQAIVDSNFSQVIQFKSIKDTIYSGFQIGIDSVVVNSIQGLPEGITYSINPKKAIKGGEGLCILFSGMPKAGSEKGGEGANGRYKLRIDYTMSFTFFGNPQHFQRDLSEYVIAVKAQTVSLMENRNNEISAFPNPCNNNVTLTFKSDFDYEKEINIIGADGKLVYRGNHTGSTVVVNMGNLKSGIYMIRAIGNNNIQQIPIMVE